MQALPFWIEGSTRRTWGFVLVLAALTSFLGAALMESLGLVSSSIKPLTFVTVVVLLMFGLFLFWPVMINFGKERTTELVGIIERRVPKKANPSPVTSGKVPRSVALWDRNDPRIDIALFSGNVPTFVLNHEQRILDWNPSFELVFGRCHGVTKGAHVSAWFSHLDNFRRVSRRQEKLYGEGILPIADRERATFVSPEFGRMVFTKIMTPIIDRRTGRVLGWTIVLNLNSVTKREAFLQALFDYVANETKRIRHAATYDGVLSGFAGLKRLYAKHVEATTPGRALVIGAGTGALALSLARAGHRVTAVEGDTHLLRQLRDKAQTADAKIRLVRQEPTALRGLPAQRFDSIHLPYNGHAFAHLGDLLGTLAPSLKAGGTLCISAIHAGGSIETMLETARAELEKAGLFEALEHQYNCVVEQQTWLASVRQYRYLPVDELRQSIINAGFQIDHEEPGLVDGHAVLVVARRA